MIRVRSTFLGTVALAALAACSDTPAEPMVQAPSNAPTSRASDPVVPGQVLVGYRDGVDGARLARNSGASEVQSGYEGRFQILSIEPGQ